jgi:hypothetical protein
VHLQPVVEAPRECPEAGPRRVGSSRGAYTSSESYLDNGSSGFRSRRAAHYVSYPYLLFEEAEHEEGPESLQRVCKRRGMRSAADVTL